MCVRMHAQVSVSWTESVCVCLRVYMHTCVCACAHASNVGAHALHEWPLHALLRVPGQTVIQLHRHGIFMELDKVLCICEGRLPNASRAPRSKVAGRPFI